MTNEARTITCVIMVGNGGPENMPLLISIQTTDRDDFAAMERKARDAFIDDVIQGEGDIPTARATEIRNSWADARIRLAFVFEHEPINGWYF